MYQKLIDRHADWLITAGLVLVLSTVGGGVYVAATLLVR